MKKSLIALAVLGGASFMLAGTPAMAQSSVTLYGVADAGIGQVKSPALGARKGVTMLSSDTMNNGNSRFGVRGVEDLGSGLKVGFNFEDGLSLRDGHAGTSGGQFWSRQANVWIGSEQFGQLTLGRAFNPAFLSGAVWELTDYANYSVVGASYGFSGIFPRTSSQFRYDTPTIAGFTGRVAYVTHADNNTNTSVDTLGGLAQVATHGQGGMWDAGATYVNGPIAIGADVSKQHKHQSTTTLSATPLGAAAATALGVPVPAPVTVSNDDGRLAYGVGAKYSFMNMFRVATSFNATPTGRRGVSLGGTYYTGPFSVTLDVTRDVHQEFGGKKRTNGLLEGKYALSKRTFVYAAFLHFDAKNNYGLGMRHNF